MIEDGRREALTAAAELYGGELRECLGVQDPAFANWLRDERERLHDAACSALLRLLDHHTAIGDLAGTMAAARRLLDPLDDILTVQDEVVRTIVATLSERALALDHTEAMAHDAAAVARLYHGRHDEAAFHSEKARTLNPSDAGLVMARGHIAMFGGDHDMAIEQIKQAARLNPFGRFGFALVMALFCARRYDEAIAALKAVRGRLPHGYVFLSASHARAGVAEESRAAVAQLLASAKSQLTNTGAPVPESWRRFFAERFPFRRSGDLDHLLAGLRGAGLPD